jgi:hypothetical protein
MGLSVAPRASRKPTIRLMHGAADFQKTDKNSYFFTLHILTNPIQDIG